MHMSTNITHTKVETSVDQARSTRSCTAALALDLRRAYIVRENELLGMAEIYRQASKEGC